MAPCRPRAQVGAFVRGCAGAAYPWFVAMVEVHKGEGLLETESILKQSTYVEMHAVDLTQLGSGAISGRLGAHGAPACASRAKHLSRGNCFAIGDLLGHLSPCGGWRK